MNKLRTFHINALQWADAHVSFQKATADLELEYIGKDVEGVPYTIWQLVEHMRIAQRDILEFSIGEKYTKLHWPEDYWPDEKAPASNKEWKDALKQIQDDRQQMIDLIRDETNDLFEPMPHGSGQHLCREAILLIDHDAYHTGQIVTIRKMLGRWR